MGRGLGFSNQEIAPSVGQTLTFAPALRQGNPATAEMSLTRIAWNTDPLRQMGKTLHLLVLVVANGIFRPTFSGIALGAVAAVQPGEIVFSAAHS